MLKHYHSYIEILSPDSTARSEKIKSPITTAGSAADNEVWLAGADVADQHARIEFDGVNYRVVDLDSQSGTFLDDVRLTPGVPQLWQKGQVVRIGQNWLRLEMAEVRQPGSPTNPSQEPVLSQNANREPRSESQLAIFSETPHLFVTPGGTATVSFVVINQGTGVTPCQLSIEGIASSWLTHPPLNLELIPGMQQTVKLVIRPPKSPESRAGQHQLTVRVANQSQPAEAVDTEITLTIPEYFQSQSTLAADRIKADQVGQVVIENKGNSPQTYRLKFRDWSGELAFKPAEIDVEVAAGDREIVKFRAKPQQLRWFGGEQTHPFGVQIQAAAGDVQKHQGEIVSTGQLSSALVPVFLVLCCAASLAVGYLQRDLIAAALGTPTSVDPIAAATATAIPSPTLTSTPVVSSLSDTVPTIVRTADLDPGETSTPTSTNTAAPTPAPVTPTPNAPSPTTTPTTTATATDTTTPPATATDQPPTPTPLPPPTDTPEPPPPLSPMVDSLLNRIPLVVLHDGYQTCASYNGFNNLLDEVAEGHVLSPNSGDFVWKSRACPPKQGNVLLKYTNGTFQLIRAEPIERFCSGEEFIPYQEALEMFSSGEIEWNGCIGCPGGRNPDCDPR